MPAPQDAEATAAPGGARLPAAGRLAAQVMHFGRLLRRAGLALPTDRIELALQALQVTGIESRGDFHDTLAACFLDRVEHREVFDLAFELFWRESAVAAAGRAPGPGVPAPSAAAPPASQRLGEAMFPSSPPTATHEPQTGPIAASSTATDQERLRHADFDTMSADEWRQAQALLRTLAPLFEPLPTRRSGPAAGPGRHARVDGRATLRRSGAPRRRSVAAALAPPAHAAGAAGGAGRHLGLDEPLLAHAAAFRPCARPCRRCASRASSSAPA